MRSIPRGWEAAALGDVCRVVSGATPKTGVAEYWGGDIPWITPNDLSKDRAQVVFRGERNLTGTGYVSCSARTFPAGSVIVSSRAPIGYVAVAGAEMCTNQGCKTAVPPTFIDSRYLYWFLVQAKPDMEARASGTTFKEISGGRFAETEFWWPSLDQQRRIVAILEDHLSRLDAAAKLVSGVSRRGAALRRSWLSKCIGDPPANELFTVGERLVEARGGWSRGRQHEVVVGGVPYLKMNNITRDGRLDLNHVVRVTGTLSDVERFAVRSGDVLFNSKNSGDLVGKTSVATSAVAGWTFNENIMRLRFDEGVIPEFAGMWFQGARLRNAIRSSVKASTNVAAIYLNQLRQMPIWVPPISTQESLLEGYDQTHISGERRLREQISVAQRMHSHLRRALLAAAFSGRLT